MNSILDFLENRFMPPFAAASENAYIKALRNESAVTPVPSGKSQRPPSAGTPWNRPIQRPCTISRNSSGPRTSQVGTHRTSAMTNVATATSASGPCASCARFGRGTSSTLPALLLVGQNTKPGVVKNEEYQAQAA